MRTFFTGIKPSGQLGEEHHAMLAVGREVAGEVKHQSRRHAKQFNLEGVRGDGGCAFGHGADYFNRLHHERAKKRAMNQLEAMGYQVTLTHAS